MQFKEQVAVITGGTRGIGKAITLAFVQQGAKAIAIYNSNQTAAEDLLQVIQNLKLPGSIEVMKASVNSFTDIEKAIQSIKKEKGRIDILVNNAGVYGNGYLAISRASQCDQIIDVNLKGTIYSTMVVSRIMMQQKQGYIINMASINGITPFAGSAVYAASKAGIVAFNAAIAEELNPYGILVTGIAPGLVETDMTQKIKQDSVDRYYAISGSKKLLKPDEVAKWVLKLANPDAKYLQGQTITIKG